VIEKRFQLFGASIFFIESVRGRSLHLDIASNF